MNLCGLGKGRRYVMTCKDCLSYDVCRRIDNEILYNLKGRSLEQVETDLQSKCDLFKNNAHIICVPDDTIMYIQDKWLVINTESEQLGEAIKGCLDNLINR